METEMDTSTPFLNESRVNELDNDGSSSASASILSMPDPLSSSSVQVVPPQLPLPHDSDHSDHEFESDSDSESSFPSVTSSFFFSSPASVASEGTGSGAARELTIPPLTLPEALASPPLYYPLDTPHASSYGANTLRLLVVGPERVKQELDDTISAEQLLSVVPIRRDLESVITTILTSFSESRMLVAVVLVSDSHVMNDTEIARFAKVLSPLVPLIHLNYDRAPSSILSSQNAPLAALDVSSVQELHNALTHQPEASQRLRTEAVEKYLKWAAQRNTSVAAPTEHLDDDLTPIKDRRASVRLYGSDITALDSSHIKDDSTVVLGIDLPSASGSTVEPEGTWTQFKAQWEASLEEAYSSSRDMKLTRRQVDSTPESEEDALFASRVPHTVAHAAVHGTGTVKARKPSRTKKSTTRNSSSTSSSSLSSLLPPSTITSSLSLSLTEESLFISTDELPSTPLIPPVPLVVAFPFPASSSSHRPSRGASSRARSRRSTPGSTSPYSYSHSNTSQSFILDLHTHTPLHPLHLPSSLITLSFSIFAPLAPIRAQLWDLISRKLLLTSPRDRRITDGHRRDPSHSHGHHGGGANVDIERNSEDVDIDDKLTRSFDSVDSLDTECNAERNNASTTTEASTKPASGYRFRRGLWPTGVMIVGGFLLGFAVGYLSVKGM